MEESNLIPRISWWQDMNSELKKKGFFRKKTSNRGQGLFTSRAYKKGQIICAFDVVSHFFTPKINGKNAFEDLDPVIRMTGDINAPSCSDTNDYSTICKFVWKILKAASCVDVSEMQVFQEVNQTTTPLAEKWFERFDGGKAEMPLNGPGMQHFSERDMNFLLSEFPEMTRQKVLKIIHMVMRSTKPIVFNRPDFSDKYPCVGQAFSAPLSRVNHACNCNMVIVVTSRSIVAYARRDIREGDELTLFYPDREREMFNQCLCSTCNDDKEKDNAEDLLNFVEKNIGKEVLNVKFATMSAPTRGVVLSYALPVCFSQYIFMHTQKENREFFTKHKKIIQEAAFWCQVTPVTYLINCLFGSACAESDYRGKWLKVINMFK